MKAEQQRPDMLQETDHQARNSGKALLRTARVANLALIDAEDGGPLASRIGWATDMDGSPIFTTSHHTDKAKAIAADNRASAIIGESSKGDPLAQARMSIRGRVYKITDAGDIARVRRRYLAQQPKSKLYIDLGDFACWRMEIERASYFAGFGQAFRFLPEDILTSLDHCQALLETEQRIVDHMNEDHKDAVGLYATVLCKKDPGNWKITGLDPEGVNLMTGTDTCRLRFDQPLLSADEIGGVLIALAKRARSHAA